MSLKHSVGSASLDPTYFGILIVVGSRSKATEQTIRYNEFSFMIFSSMSW